MAEKDILGVIFSNMHDEMIPELTSQRTTGSVPFGGRYRMVDFPLSNMVNAGIQNVGIITKSNYQSLMDHLGSGRFWDLSRKIGGLRILPPFGQAHTGVYRGRLEALVNILDYVEHSSAKYVVLADCDTVANMDYQKLIAYHEAKQADITIAYKKMELSKESAALNTVFDLDENGAIVDTQIFPARGGNYCVDLNVMVLDRIFLLKIIQEAASRKQFSFKETVLLGKLGSYRMYGYEFNGFAAHIDSMLSFYQANLQLLDNQVIRELFDPSHPIFTKVRDEAPAKYGLNAKVSNSLVADGCVIDGEVENCILFRSCRIAKGAKVKNSIIMQGTVIEQFASLDSVITDKDVVIREGRALSGYTSYPIYVAKGKIV